MSYTASELIRLLSLQPHPEGGWFAFREASGIPLLAGALAGFSGERDTCSYIYYLLQKGEISRWHQLRAAEIWTWHLGGSLETTLGGSGSAPAAVKALALGPHLETGEQFQRMIPAGQWQTTRLTAGDFALVSCVVSPAFRDEDCLLPDRPLPNEIY